MSTEPRSAPAVARNRDPILAVLRDHLPLSGLVVEIAAGTGEHGVHMARNLPGLTWLPTDPDPLALTTIQAWRADAALPNLLPAIALDASDPAGWPVPRADALVCINMVHISPWATTQGLMEGAGRVLGPGGVLYLYGPYREPGVPTAPSNDAFDANLKARDPAWGLRDLDVVVAEAAKHGLTLTARLDMPANNLSLVFKRA